MGNKTVLVIGAGLGGITTAARLARHGYQVTVAEKCEYPGGRCGRLVKDGHHFATGATLFLMPEIFAQTFADLGECMEDHLDLRRIDPTYRIHFRDGSTLALTSDLHTMRTQLEAMEQGSFGGFLRYLDEGHRHYRLALPHLVERDWGCLLEYCSPRNLLLLFQLKVLVKHYDNIGHYFHDRRLKAAFTFQDIYLGLSPFKAPSVYSLLPYSEFADGVWFPMGGMVRVAEALTGIAERWGVQFLYNTPVKQINVENRRATGVTLKDGRQLQADIVVANADLPYVYRHLLPDDGSSDQLERRRYSCSALMFYWGVDKQYPQLEPHNLFVTGDYRQSFDRIYKDFTVSDDPSFYVHAPVRIDPSLAPQGQDTLVVVVPAGHINDAAPQDWATIQKRTRQVLLERLAAIGVADLNEHIKFEVVHTPRDWQTQYNLAKGSAHGLSHDVMQMGYLRPRNRHKRYRNLYFVGASTHPGTGLPVVLISARLTSDRILQEAGVPRTTFIQSAPSRLPEQLLVE